METFVNLHSHTSASHLDAIIRPAELFKRVLELGQTAISATDHGNMANCYQLYKEYKKYKKAGTPIKFIPGNEIYFVEDLNDPKSKRRHLVLLASNEAGYRNLLRITSAGYDNSTTIMGKQFPRVDTNILKKYNEGIYATSACGGGLLGNAIINNDLEKAQLAAELFKNIFRDRFFIELQPHTLQRGNFNQTVINDTLKSIAEQLNIEMIAVCDSHYLTRKHEKYQDMILAMANKTSLDDPERHRYTTFEPCLICDGKKVFPADSETVCYSCYGQGGLTKQCPEFYLKTEKEIFDFFSKRYDGAFANKLIANTRKIADACENPDYMEPKGNRLPTFPWEDEVDSQEFLEWLDRTKSKEIKILKKDQAYMRFKVKKAFDIYCKDFDKEKKSIYWKRVLVELETLEKQDFCSYMLIVADFIGWAKRNGVRVGPGRGSIGGSCVAFFLGIHIADPIRYDLVFERFHNKLKPGSPDADTDFSPSGRAKVIEYVRNKYGADKVSYISNILHLTPKIVIKDICRSLTLGGDKSTAFKIANAITAEIPDTVNRGDKIIKVDTMEKALEYSKALREFVQQYPDVLDYATQLVGLERGFGVHAGGIIISDVPLSGYAPMRRDNDGDVSTQWDKNECEENGLIKMDFLGLDTLDVLQETYEMSKAIGIDIPDPDHIPENDEKTYRLIGTGETVGMFQLNGTLAKFCKLIKPTNVEDIALVNAMGRPGCPAAERKEILARRSGKAKITYDYPLLEKALAHTYGIFVYDEDLLKMAKDLAGWDLAEADGLRKLTKLKEKGADLAIKLEKKFVDDAVKNNKIPREQAQKLWDNVIVNCAKYSFSYIHSILYSITSYHTAYYKTYSPGPFFCALLNAETRGNKLDRDESIDTYKKDMKKFKIAIQTCDINLSKQYYTMKDRRTLITGLGAIKGLGEKALDAIIANQPYTSFEDFLHRTPSSSVNKTAIIALSKAGAFDSFHISRKYAAEHYGEIRTQLLKLAKRKDIKELEKIKQAAVGFGDGYEQDVDMTQEIMAIFDYVDKDKSTIEWDIKEKLINEREVLGEYISGSPDILYPGFFKEGQYAQPFAKIATLPDGANFPTEGIVGAVREISIKKAGKNQGKIMAKITIENLLGETCDATVFADIYEKSKSIFKSGTAIRGLFKINEFNGSKSLVLVSLEAVCREIK